MGHIPTKLHQFPTSNFRDFVQTDRQTPPKTIPARSIAGAQVGDVLSVCEHCQSMATVDVVL